MKKLWMSAAEAARLLGVRRETLYAYVSRGLVRSEVGSGATRARRYARDDIERLKRRADERRNPDKLAEHTLQWGLPVLESSITLIADSTLYYRGHDAIALARSATVEQAASLIWTGRLDGTAPPAAPASRAALSLRKPATFIRLAQAALIIASADDPQAFDLRPAGVARTGWQILDALVSTVVRRARDESIAAALARGWKVRAGGEDLIRPALILCADHELNVSARIHTPRSSLALRRSRA